MVRRLGHPDHVDPATFTTSAVTANVIVMSFGLHDTHPFGE